MDKIDKIENIGMVGMWTKLNKKGTMLDNLNKMVKSVKLNEMVKNEFILKLDKIEKVELKWMKTIVQECIIFSFQTSYSSRTTSESLSCEI